VRLVRRVVGPLAAAALLAVLLPAGGPVDLGPMVPVSTGRPPVFDFNAADPEILRVGDVYYTYTTNNREWWGGFTNVPILRSSNLESWGQEGDALPDLGDWATPGQTWAPTVGRFGGTYVMFYSARHRTHDRQCIGRATSTSPTGPFVPQNTPVRCHLSLGGAIDPFIFRDVTGASYLYWKNDGNCCGVHTTIWAQRLTGGGVPTGS